MGLPALSCLFQQALAISAPLVSLPEYSVYVIQSKILISASVWLEFQA